MKHSIEELRKIADGQLNESTLLSADASQQNEAFELDGEELDEAAVEKLLAECARSLAPMFLQHEILGESAIAALEEAVVDGYAQLENYLSAQGLQEAAAPSINPRLNVVHLNRQALMNRYRAKMILALARRANSTEFKKYKMACAMKKENFKKMASKYGTQADRLTKQYFAKMKRSGKVSAVVDSKKPEVAKKVSEKSGK